MHLAYVGVFAARTTKVTAELGSLREKVVRIASLQLQDGSREDTGAIASTDGLIGCDFVHVG
jgi:hypothetical protein